ncbi:expressed unknown protein [Seminavis robusta]|uniref:Uncharacterized protein n=1 Tax=Seminavis robusta TaxID=568900 RepID=A0A9N8HAJ5_9STRA|nr:expressed unknown protein [Seminavis robusta]|eukprot:Sro299_g111280.1 n/a (527) ;mRNA; r:11897-13477
MARTSGILLVLLLQQLQVHGYFVPATSTASQVIRQNGHGSPRPIPVHVVPPALEKTWLGRLPRKNFLVYSTRLQEGKLQDQEKEEEKPTGTGTTKEKETESADPSSPKDTTSTSTSPPDDKVQIEGIGGKGGVVYDVNRLKRNLLQETMTVYKEELWDLLEGSDAPTSSNQDIVEKLLALVQASPVRTTTDSNLLDGQDDWVLAYRSQYPTTIASLLMEEGSVAGTYYYNARYTFLWNSTTANNYNQEEETRNNKRRSFVFWDKIKEFVQSKQRTFRLEDLAEDEDAYVKDTTYMLGGILTRTQYYALDGLTRSSLILQPFATQWSLMGRCPPQPQQGGEHSTNNNKPQVSVHIVYLDNDLCILTEEDGPDSPFWVYTRNKAYRNVYKSMRRKFKLLGAAMWGLVPLPQRRQRSRKRQPMLTEISSGSSTDGSMASSSNKLRVLRLGDMDEDDDSWESDSDPFIHLSADERQRVLKEMSVEEITDKYRNTQKRFRWLRKMFARRKRKQTFKAPPETWRRPQQKKKS